jgi:RND family efflux transporter MFP subunit
MKHFLLLGSILLFSLGISGCGQEKPPSLDLPDAETITLQTEEFTPSLSLTGTIEAQKSISLASKISGRIDMLLVDIGDRVSKDQIVARFSTVDDQTQIAYTNSLSQLQTTRISTQSSIQSAEIAVSNSKQQHEQSQRQEQANMQQLRDTLNARTNSAHTVLERILSFLDTTMGVSPQFQYGGSSSLIVSIGNNDTIGKQNIKNEISLFIQAKANNPFPFSSDPLENALQEIASLKKLQTITQQFYALARNTPVTDAFPESQRESLQQIIEQSLSELSGEILAIETQMRATQTAQEQLGLNLIQTENAIKNAEAQLEMARANSGQQLQIAHNQILSAKNMHSELELKAPFNGIITQRFVEEGALVAPGNPVFELADRERLKIYTDISDRHSGAIAEGMPVQIKIDGLSDVFSGHITRINPSVNPNTRTLGIEILLDESPEVIRIGMFAHITVSLPKKEAFFVPKQYVQAQFSGPFVLTKDGTHIAIELGEEQDGMTEIIAENLQNGLQLRSN